MNAGRIEITTPGAREKFEDWILFRGGIAVWENVNLSNPLAGDAYTPAATKREDGEWVPANNPHWSTRFGRVVTDIGRFRFARGEVTVRRMRIAVRMGSQGMTLKLTDTSSRRLQETMDQIAARFKRNPTYHFEYDEAVITLPIFEDDPEGWPAPACECSLLGGYRVARAGRKFRREWSPAEYDVRDGRKVFRYPGGRYCASCGTKKAKELNEKMTTKEEGNVHAL